MENINTVEKGNAFEMRVYEIVKDLLENEELIVSPKRSKIFQKKGYYSESRKSLIIFDITIETYIGDSPKYSTLIVIECKDYSSAVPVNDIEEFDSKLNQIGEHNTKGMVVANSPFQSGAINTAISKGIGLARINTSNIVDWISHRKDNNGWINDLSLTKSLLSDEENKDSVFTGYFNGFSFASFPDLLFQFDIIKEFSFTEKYLNIPYLSDEAIDYKICELALGACYENRKLNIERFCARISEVYDVAFDFNESIGENNNNLILGKISYHPLIIYVNKALLKDPHRFRYTLLHEVGHLVLHCHLLLPYFDYRVETDALFGKDYTFSNDTTKRLEIQANIFASQTLLPTGLFGDFVSKLFKKENIHKGHIFLDDQPCNQVRVHGILSEIEKTFDVSKEVAKLRLKKLRLLKDATDNSFNTLIRKMNF